MNITYKLKSLAIKNKYRITIGVSYQGIIKYKYLYFSTSQEFSLWYEQLLRFSKYIFYNTTIDKNYIDNNYDEYFVIWLLDLLPNLSGLFIEDCEYFDELGDIYTVIILPQ